MSWQLLCQCLSPHVWLRRMFFQLNSIYSKVCSSRRIYIAPFLSQLNKTLPNTCFASEPYSLIHGLLETFQSGWFHECICTPAETTSKLRSWLEWILQNQVPARRLELNKIIFRQIAPTLYDFVVFKEITIQRLKKAQDGNGYSKIWIKAYIEVSCFSRSFCKNLVQGANNVCLITVPFNTATAV